MPIERELGVAVLSLGAQAGLEEAVASLLGQDQVPEIVVVNSGGGALRRACAGPASTCR